MKKAVCIKSILLVMIFFIGCREYSIEEKTFDKNNYENDLTSLLKMKKIDSLLYLRGLILKTNDFSAKMQGRTYKEVIAEIESKTELTGYTDKQLFRNEDVEISGLKNYTGRDSIIEFSYKVKFKDSSLIKIGDSVKIVIYFQNIGGGEIMTMIHTREIRDDNIASLELNVIDKVNFRDFYKFKPSDFVSSKKLNDSAVIKYSNFCIMYIQIRRDGNLIKQIELV